MTYQSINQSISQHISLLAHDRKKCSSSSSHHFMPADAAAPSDERRLLIPNSFSLRNLFRKKFCRQFPCLLSIPSLLPIRFPRVISELLWRCCSCCFLSFLLLLFTFWSISYYNSSRSGVNVGCCCRLPACLTATVHFVYKAQSARASIFFFFFTGEPPSYSCGGAAAAAAASAAASSPSPAVSEVQSVRLSRSSCMIRVLSL